ncbi:MAG: MgtC/SapB family protein [Pisciglobus halotolerans]|nr:MgtC/SapB family protein [Pisciglobus halotolerans]
MIDLSTLELIGRMVGAILFGSLIGYEREIKGQSAGLRTHMLVCIGSAIIALVQVEATYEAISIVQANPDYGQVISSDFTRLTAQVISGIGFLGAGTIIVTKKSVSGLTTAASIWATAGIGIAIGMGYYKIAFAGTLTILIVLAMIKRVLNVPGGKSLVVQYEKKETHQLILDYFEKYHIKIFGTEYRIDFDPDTERTMHTHYYTMNIPAKVPIYQIIEDIGHFDSVIHVSSQKDA